MKTIEGILESDGRIRLLEKITPVPSKRVLVVFLDDSKSDIEACETALLSEAALAEDWNRPEEDQAWKHLQQVQ